MSSTEDLRDRFSLNTNRVGSVFLGDIQRHRQAFSSSNSNHSAQSTPPSSPPNTGVFPFHHHHHHLQSFHPASPPPMSSLSEDIDIDDIDEEESDSPAEKNLKLKTKDLEARIGASKPGTVDPQLALELRLRWLEALILGVKQDLSKDRKGKAKEAEYAGVNAATTIAAANLKHGETLVRLAQSVQQKLDKALEGNEGLKRFMDNYDRHSHLLTPSFALSGILPDPPTYDKMTQEEINAFLAEMEPDIRAADRDMLEIDALEKKGVLGAGKLPEYETLEPRLQPLLKAYQADAELATSLEIRIASLVQRHATYIDTLSELFVAWDDTLTDAEDRLSRMEREKAERRRLGLT